MTETEYARYRGVTKQYISKLKKEGMIAIVDGKVDVQASDAGLDKTVTMDSQGSTSLAKAQLADLLIKVQIRKIELAQKRGEVVDVKKVIEQQTKAFAAVRDAMLSLPDHLAQELSGMTQPREIREYLMRQITASLENSAASIEAMVL